MPRDQQFGREVFHFRCNLSAMSHKQRGFQLDKLSELMIGSIALDQVMRRFLLAGCFFCKKSPGVGTNTDEAAVYVSFQGP